MFQSGMANKTSFMVRLINLSVRALNIIRSGLDHFSNMIGRLNIHPGLPLVLRAPPFI